MTAHNPFHFYANFEQSKYANAFVAVLPDNISTKESLLGALALQLVFPAYFGGNWDALFDCLRDFHWINERDVVLVHQSVPSMSEHDLKTYLSILRDSMLDWRPDEDHQFLVAFPVSEEVRIEALLA